MTDANNIDQGGNRDKGSNGDKPEPTIGGDDSTSGGPTVGAEVERKPLSREDIDLICEQHLNFIHDTAQTIGVTCNILTDYVYLRDHAGINYSIRQIIARTKALRDVAKLMFVFRRENENG
jgi:hypothetical protein